MFVNRNIILYPYFMRFFHQTKQKALLSAQEDPLLKLEILTYPYS